MKTMMNRLSGAALLFVLFTGTAWSTTTPDTGILNFTGKITASSCTVDTVPVPLPTISTQALKTAGSSAGLTRFTITLSACSTGGAETVQIRFRNGTNIDQTTHNLKETTASTHVQIRLLNSAQAEINLVDNTNSPTLIPSGGNASFILYAEYFAPTLNSVTAGSVAADLPFDLIYP